MTIHMIIKLGFCFSKKFNFLELLSYLQFLENARTVIWDDFEIQNLKERIWKKSDKKYPHAKLMESVASTVF